MRLLILFVLVIISCASTSFAQSQHKADYRGTNFWVAFPENAKSENGSIPKLSIVAIGDKGTNVRFVLPSKTKSGQIGSDRFIECIVDTGFQVLGDESISAKGILVVADHIVSVYVFDRRQASSDSYSAIPTNELGKEYIVAGFDPLFGPGIIFSTQCDVIATENDTHVHITSRIGEVPNSWDVSLKRGEVYQLRTHTGVESHDLTGTRVSSNNPVAFLTGHQCAQVPAEVSFCDILLEQEPSIDNFGTDFIAPKIQLKDRYSIRIVATEDNTGVSINSVLVKTLSNGSSYTNDTLTKSALIKTSKPVLVCEYGQSSDADASKVGDPFMFVLAPTPNFIRECSLFVPYSQLFTNNDSLIESDGLTRRYLRRESPTPVPLIQSAPPESEDHGWKHFVTIVTESANADTFTFDGRQLAPITVESISGTNYKVLQFSVSGGPHRITSSTPFALYAYGFGMNENNYDSYGHTAGQMLNLLSEP